MHSTSGVRGCKRRNDQLRHTVKIFEDVVVPETDHTIACDFEKCCPATVAFAFGMLSAVSLDDQAMLLTNEINDERPDRLLTSELCAFELS